MEILVCVKRVPDTAENEIEVNSDGSGIETDDLVYSVNEWDNYAVEEAIQIRDDKGGSGIERDGINQCLAALSVNNVIEEAHVLGCCPSLEVLGWGGLQFQIIGRPVGINIAQFTEPADPVGSSGCQLVHVSASRQLGADSKSALQAKLVKCPGEWGDPVR